MSKTHKPLASCSFNAARAPGYLYEVKRLPGELDWQAQERTLAARSPRFAQEQAEWMRRDLNRWGGTLHPEGTVQSIHSHP